MSKVHPARENVLASLRHGASATTAAAAHGLSISTVSKWAKAAGIALKKGPRATPWAKDDVGSRHGRWTVLRFAGHRGPRRLFLCRCDCGTEREVAIILLRSGQSRSCGCLQQEANDHAHLVHGHARRGAESPEFRTWKAMHQRCYDRSASNYTNYGGRGIAIRDRWRDDFSAFLADMGPKPSPGHSIDRINNDGNYEPGNCRWATRSEQRRNQRPRR